MGEAAANAAALTSPLMILSRVVLISGLGGIVALRTFQMAFSRGQVWLSRNGD